MKSLFRIMNIRVICMKLASSYISINQIKICLITRSTEAFIQFKVMTKIYHDKKLKITAEPVSFYPLKRNIFEK